LIAIVKGAICSALHPADPLSLEAIFYFFFKKIKVTRENQNQIPEKKKKKKSRFFSVPQRVGAAGMYINKWQLL
jgi:hypothetical protein